MANGHDPILNLIDGEWVSPETRRTVPNVNPADTREKLGTVVDSGASDVARAVDAAKRAATGWRRVPAPRRGDLILEAMRLMTQRKEAIARALTLEEGKTYSESLGEVMK